MQTPIRKVLLATIIFQFTFMLRVGKGYGQNKTFENGTADGNWDHQKGDVYLRGKEEPRK